MQNSSPSTSNGYCWPTKANPGPNSARVWSIRKIMASQWRVPELLRSNVWEQWLRPFLCWLRAPRQARTPPRLCPRLPEACQRHGPSLLEAGGVRPRLHPQMREPLNLLPPASPYVANISSRLNGLHRWRPGGHRGLTNPAWMSLAGSPPRGTGRFPRWHPPRSYQRRRRAYTTPATRSAATNTSNHRRGKDPAQLQSVE